MDADPKLFIWDDTADEILGALLVFRVPGCRSPRAPTAALPVRAGRLG
jgi:hypothetical protein